MSDGDHKMKQNGLEQDVQEMKIKSGSSAERNLSNPATMSVAEEVNAKDDQSSLDGETFAQRLAKKSASNSPVKQSGTPRSPAIKLESEQTVGGDITVKMEPGQAPKISRTASKKILSRPPTLFLDLPNKTAEAVTLFEEIPDCIYANKFLGTTDHALECDCAEEWDPATASNNACGEDSDCINRATKMECIGDCDCGAGCQNQRFQRRQYANVSVIKTEKKGYGLRAETDLRPGEFIFEYIGEVIGEQSFRRRMQLYDQEGIRHFYFMSLNKGEFVDATKRGNLGRFCNHSCNPNCYVDKWVVGEKLRMGIFAERKIIAGEELVFNYNVDRYGADPQPCYCGEPNCTGFIGGKTQTDRATKLSALTIEALGLEDADDWDLATSKKPRKKKTGEDDEEYVDSLQPRSLDESGVTKVMATLMQCKEKWIAVKLLSRIQRCDEEKVRNRVVKMHGYQILNSTLSTWIEDDNVVLQILDILDKLPRLTRNKIQDSKIEGTVEKLITSENELVKDRASAILKIWASLEVGYRIPRIKRDPAAIAAAVQAEREERRRAQRERSKSESPEIPKGPAAPTGPRSGVPSRSFAGPRPPFRRPFQPPLPMGWFSAQSNGQTYYYSADGKTTWTRPTVAATQPPPPPKVMTNEQKLQEIINSITKKEISTPKEKSSATNTPQPSSTPNKPERKAKTEKWRSYSEEKKMKLYENTLFPHIKYVMDKYKSKLPKDDLKRFAKEAGKSLVRSDFKHKRVEDPTQITSKHERQVKKYVKEYFDKAVSKKKDHDRRKAERLAKEGGPNAALPPTPIIEAPSEQKDEFAPDDPMTLSDDDAVASDDEISPTELKDEKISAEMDLKRKAEAILAEEEGEDNLGPSKRARPDESPLQDAPAPPPPPPPPPPPADGYIEPAYGDQMEHDETTHLESLPSLSPADMLKPLPEHLLSNKASFARNGIISATNITPDSPSDQAYRSLDISNSNSHPSDDAAPSHFATPPNEDTNDEAKIHQRQRVDIRQES